MHNDYQASVEQLEARIADLTQQLDEVIAERDKTNLLYEISAALNAALDFEAIAATAVSFASRLGATSAEIHLMTNTGQLYSKSSYAQRNIQEDGERRQFVQQILTEGLESWVVKHRQSVLINDTATDERWPTFDYTDPKGVVRSCICAPLVIDPERIWGAITFVHPETHHFNEQDVVLLEAMVNQISVALENSVLLEDLQRSLQETNWVAVASQKLVATSNLDEAYAALAQSIVEMGADRAVLHVCDDLDIDDTPKHSEVVYVQDVISGAGEEEKEEKIGRRFALAQYPALDNLVQTKETLVIANITEDERLGDSDRQFLSDFGIESVAIIPLVARNRVIGLLFIQHRTPHDFSDRELALYHTVCNQSIVAIENAKQMQLTKIALTETQTLYRAGRVLAGTTNLQDILQESLFEFLYSLNLDQGGITLLSPDRQRGELVAYVQDGQVQEIESLEFDIDATIPYQQVLLSGQPFQSYDVPNDARLVNFKHFNQNKKLKSLLQAPMIIHGETVGWIGADSVKEHRIFSERETDLARAMADQIAITIQNRRLLERSERQAEQLKAVAQVGKSVAELLELDEILNSTVDLIRDQFNFYHVSIFLLDRAGEWAVVRASTGDIGRIMVERPHKLKVGGQSIVGYVTANNESRVVRNVGEDRIHFDNPLLPETRSEMALPMILRGKIIGALDVQSVEVNAFEAEEIETLQIMADQLSAAIENARLFEQTQRTLRRTQSLYRVGEALAGTTDLRSTFELVLGECLKLLNIKQGSLILTDKSSQINVSRARYIDGRPIEPSFALPLENDLVFQHLAENPEPLIIEDAPHNLLTKDSRETRGQTHVQSMLFIPVIARGRLVGSIVADSTEVKHKFSQSDIKTGEAIADQLGIWLENRELFDEAQHRSNLLQAAAEVSRAASSILEPEQLINEAVNLIRSRFDLYYVGLFQVEGQWAVLRAGTGEAGRLQIENGHRLMIGSGSMIGWSIKNRRAKIALDVGKESVDFKKNEFLPLTRSEMALPLISREDVIGALTVQSVERGAFSGEDIALLQTMADQLANAITNARLFESVAQARHEAEARLQETLALQQLSKQLSSTLQVDEILEIMLQACTKVIGFDYVQFSLVEQERNQIRAITGVGVSEQHIKLAHCSLDSDDIMADVIRTGKTEIITGWDERLNEQIYDADEQANRTRLFIPVTLRQENIGVIEAGLNKTEENEISDTQLRLLRAFMDQTVIALENAQRYEISRRAARREEIIREISSKIRGAVSIEEIMKTTISELSKVVGTSQGGITLAVDSQDPVTTKPTTDTKENGHR